MRFRVTLIAVLAVVFVGLVPTVGAAADTIPDRCDTSDEISQGDLTRVDSDSFRADLTKDPGREVSLRFIALSDVVRVKDSDNLQRDGPSYEWDEDAATASITYTVAENASRFTVKEEWAYIPLPISYCGTEYTIDNGLRLDGHAYIGNYSIAETTSDSGENIELYISSAVSDDVPGQELVEDIATVSDDLEVGGRSDTYQALLVPHVNERAGFHMHDGHSVVEHTADARYKTILVHEYIHSRQDFFLSSEMQWFMEASATYYQWEYAVEFGYESEATRNKNTPQAENVVLTNQSTWASDEIPYHKGAAVLAALDEKEGISVEAVFRQMNQQHDWNQRVPTQLTYEEFVDIVNEQADEDLSPWLNAHVNGSETVETWEYDGRFYGGEFYVMFGLAFMAVSTLWVVRSIS